MKRLAAKIEGALLEQAHVSLMDGSRFQFRADEIGGDDQVHRFVVRLAKEFNGNVRANCSEGLVTVYGDNESDGTRIVVATIRRPAGGKGQIA